MNKTQISSEKKLTLLILCWLFGLFAVHRFYTGKYLTAGLHLLIAALSALSAIFDTEILPAVGIIVLALWLIVDMALIIMGKFTDKEGRPIVDWV